MNIERAGWSAEADHGLRVAAGSDAVLSEARDAVRTGRAQLWRVSGLVRSTYLVTRVEHTPTGRELVLWLGQGCSSKRVIKWAVQLATEHGIEQLRAHVTRPGLVRIFERLGWHKTEWVMTYGR